MSIGHVHCTWPGSSQDLPHPLKPCSHVDEVTCYDTHCMTVRRKCDTSVRVCRHLTTCAR